MNGLIGKVFGCW